MSFYNSIMGGVDLTDQLKECYQINRRNRAKFYLRIFFDIVDLSINNAHILYRKKMEMNGMRAPTTLQFRQAVVRKLAGDFSSRQRQHHARKNSINVVVPGSHLPIFNDKRRRCFLCSTKENDRRSNITCSACEKCFCLNSTRNCFFEFHM